MKTKKNVTVYICEYCGKRYFSKKWCKRHEIMHTINDKVSCFNGCKFLNKKDAEVEPLFGEHDGGNDEEFISRTVKLFFCEKRQCFIYPPSVEMKGNAFPEEELEKENIKMPEECEFFDNKYL